MRLLFKHRFFSLGCSYDILDEGGNTVYTVRTKPGLPGRVVIFDAQNNELAFFRKRLFRSQYELYLDGWCAGTIRREFSFSHRKFSVDLNGWQVEGNFSGWKYTICDASGQTVATLSTAGWGWSTEKYMYVQDPNDTVRALMLALAIEMDISSEASSSD